MSFWTFVFLCVIAGIGYDIWNKRHLAQNGHLMDEKGKLKRWRRAAKRNWKRN